MGFQYVEYNLLEEHIKESIVTEIKHHKLEKKDLKKALDTLHLTHSERAIQCKYLLVVIKALNHSKWKIEEKTVILNAAAFYVRNQIADSYNKSVCSFFLTPERSTLFNSLTTSLNLHKENFPGSRALRDMYEALSCFMHEHVYKNSDPLEGYLESHLQIFSEAKIKGYYVEKTLADLLDKKTTLQVEQINRGKEMQLAEKISDDKSEARVLICIDKKACIVIPVSDSEEENKYIFC